MVSRGKPIEEAKNIPVSSPAPELKISARSLEAQNTLARNIARQRYAALHEMLDRFGLEQDKLLEYTRYELSYFANAIAEKNPGLFTEYIDWTKSLFKSNGIPLEYLNKNADLFCQEVLSELPVEYHELVGKYIQAGMEEISGTDKPLHSFLEYPGPHVDLAQRYLSAVLAGNRGNAIQLVLDYFKTGTSIPDIYLFVLQPVQYEIGRLWQTNKITVAQEHFCSAITQLVMSQLYYPHICNSQKTKAVFVGLCVSGELHEIGIRMVADLFELAGWNVIFLGANIPSYNIVDSLIKHKADFLGISASMASSVNKAANIIAQVRASQAAATKIIVGGFGFNRDPELWKPAGADYYAGNAQEALNIAAAELESKGHG
ncbi:MAG: cobalamin-dependent protein [Pseudomonadota bacterium]